MLLTPLGARTIGLALAGATTLLVVADTLVTLRARPLQAAILSLAGATFLLTSQFLASVVLFAGALTPHVPLAVLAILLFPRKGTRHVCLRLIGASVAAGITCDRLPFLWLAAVFPIWLIWQGRRETRRRDLLITALCLAAGAYAARLLWTNPAVQGLAVGSRNAATGWVNTDLLPYRSVPWESLKFVMAVLLNRSTFALSVLFVATAILLLAGRRMLSSRYPQEYETAFLSWMVGSAFLVTGLVAPETSLIACAAFVAPAVLSNRLLGRLMLDRWKQGAGLEAALGCVLVVFQLGTGFWPIDAIGGLVRRTERNLPAQTGAAAATSGPVEGLR